MVLSAKQKIQRLAAPCDGLASVEAAHSQGAVLHVGFNEGNLYDVYAALGRLYEMLPMRFSHPAKLKKINKKAVDFSDELGYINITKRNEHELVNREHELDRIRARALAK